MIHPSGFFRLPHVLSLLLKQRFAFTVDGPTPKRFPGRRTDIPAPPSLSAFARLAATHQDDTNRRETLLLCVCVLFCVSLMMIHGHACADASADAADWNRRPSLSSLTVFFCSSEATAEQLMSREPFHIIRLKRIKI